MQTKTTGLLAQRAGATLIIIALLLAAANVLAAIQA